MAPPSNEQVVRRWVEAVVTDDENALGLLRDPTGRRTGRSPANGYAGMTLCVPTAKEDHPGGGTEWEMAWRVGRMRMETGEAIIVDHLDSVEMRPSRPVIYDRDIGVRLLYESPVSGAEHYLIRYPPGLRAQLHRHTAAHTIVVLEGRLAVNKDVIGPGAYCHFPARTPMFHAPVGDEGCLLLFIFDGPQDVEPLGDAGMRAAAR